MTAQEFMDLLSLAIWTVGIASAPALAAAMLTGTVIAVVQAVTQVQEVTLTFVPKIVAVLLTLVLSSALVASSIGHLAELCFERIAVHQR